MFSCLSFAYALDLFFLFLLVYLYLFEYPSDFDLSTSVPSAILFCLFMVLLTSVCIARYHLKRRGVRRGHEGRERRLLADGGIVIQLSQVTPTRLGPPLVLTNGPPKEQKESSIDLLDPPPSYDTVMRSASAHPDLPVMS